MMTSTIKTKVKGGWWLSCGHKASDPDNVLQPGMSIHCLKCDTAPSKHISNQSINPMKHRKVRIEYLMQHDEESVIYRVDFILDNHIVGNWPVVQEQLGEVAYNWIVKNLRPE